MPVINGKINKIIPNGIKSIIEIETMTYQAKWLEEFPAAETLTLNIRKAAGKKSLNQNNYSWALMTEIAKELDLFPDPEALYIQLIRDMKIKPDFYLLEDLPPNKKGETPFTKLKQKYRAIRIVDTRIGENGSQWIVVEVNEGMSQFNKEEMSEFIERLLDYAAQQGIDTSDYDFDR